ncbi:MAG: hypothetical protein WCP32_05880 [Bacteroidota bacterium]
MTCKPPAKPTAGANIPFENQIIWNWNPMTVAMGYKWNTANEYASAADLGNTTSKTESGLACNTTYTRYVWSYNSCGKSPANPLTQTTIQNSPVGFHRGIRQSGMCRSFSHFFNHCNQWRYITGIPMESEWFGYFGRNWRKICLFPCKQRCSHLRVDLQLALRHFV